MNYPLKSNHLMHPSAGLDLQIDFVQQIQVPPGRRDLLSDRSKFRGAVIYLLREYDRRLRGALRFVNLTDESVCPHENCPCDSHLAYLASHRPSLPPERTVYAH